MQIVTLDASRDRRLVRGIRTLKPMKQAAHRRHRRASHMQERSALRTGEYEHPRKTAYLTGWDVV